MKKQKKKGIALRVVLYLLLALFAAITCFVSVFPSGIHIEGARFGVYGCLDGYGAVPDGSYIITENTRPLVNASKVVLYGDFGNSKYPSGMKHIIIGELAESDNKTVLKLQDGKIIEIDESQLQPIAWRINYLGNIAFFLYRFRYILWAFWAAVITLIVVMEATSPLRQFKKYKKELIQTFDFYGKKYADEDLNKNY